MAKYLFLALGTLCLLQSIRTLPTSQEKLQVIRAFAATPSDVSLLRNLESENIKLDFWKDPRLNDHADIMVDSTNLKKLISVLEKNSISYDTMIEDVESVIAEQEKERQEKFANNVNAEGIDWNEYYTLSSIEGWLANLSRESSAVSILNIGTSYEGRGVQVAKISRSNGNSTKPAIFITATIHAREWIAAATATYIIDQLVSNSTAHPDILDLVDVYVLPVINPDGYAYTQQSRLWRKTRSRVNSSSCIGTDANRNFDFKWGDADVSGSSGDPCSETFRGPSPFSEPEAAAVRDYIASNSNVNWTVYITLHSYGQYFLCPWGYTRTLPPNYAEIKNLSDIGAAALTAKYGTRYTTAASSIVLYYTDGTDQDWAFGTGQFPYSYTIELRDTGSYGFLLPARLIKPTVEETFEAIKAVARNIPK
jgi:murein tripeptide amidase MpaA